jgi:hypothetical protein
MDDASRQSGVIGLRWVNQFAAAALMYETSWPELMDRARMFMIRQR